jgi:hypothetical protein
MSALAKIHGDSVTRIHRPDIPKLKRSFTIPKSDIVRICGVLLLSTQVDQVPDQAVLKAFNPNRSSARWQDAGNGNGYFFIARQDSLVITTEGTVIGNLLSQQLSMEAIGKFISVRDSGSRKMSIGEIADFLDPTWRERFRASAEFLSAIDPDAPIKTKDPDMLSDEALDQWWEENVVGSRSTTRAESISSDGPETGFSGSDL